jgi:cytosine/adenosine deaminase-related metal-dependent hydrolase
MPHLQLLKAARVYPMDQPALEEGAVVFDGETIVAVGATSQLRSRYPAAEVHDLGNSLLLPGLVNAHAHLELSALSRGVPPASFVDWLIDLMSRPLDVAAGVARGIEQSLRAGVTTIGDISRQCGITRPLLSAGPLRVVSFGEVQAMAQRRGLLEQRFAPASDLSSESRFLRVGISPHAPYSIEPAGYRKCLEFALARGRPIATHLAETPNETEFLAEQSGPFRRLWDHLGAWDDHVPRFIGGPIRFAESLGLLAHPTLLAHVNYCDDDEMALLSRGRVSVVYCPRTHAWFGHPPHRWREMLAMGVNVAVGTDSCASSTDLNLLDDLRLLHRLAPDVPAEKLFEMATVGSATAIGMHWEVGSLAPGKFADAIAFAGADLSTVLESRLSPSNVWIGGVELPPPAPSAPGSAGCTPRRAGC